VTTATSGESIAVVICTRDRPDMLAKALARATAALRPGDELVVVDSASTTGDTADVARRAGATVVRCDQPGASRARNAGIAATSAPIVAITDDDCLPSTEWITAIGRAFRGQPRLGFVTGRVDGDDPSKSLQVSLQLDDRPRGFGPDDDPTVMGHTANAAFRRAALADVGGFDELLGPGATFRSSEDKDVFWRVVRAGWLGAYDPEVVVTHRQWRGAAEAVRLRFSYGVGSGAFAVKVARIEGRRGRRMLADRLWAHGLRRTVDHVRSGYRSGIVASLARTAGVVVGALRAVVAPIDQERFVARRRRRR